MAFGEVPPVDHPEEEFTAEVEPCKATILNTSDANIVHEYEEFESALSAAPQVDHIIRLHFWVTKLGMPDKAAKLSANV